MIIDALSSGADVTYETGSFMYNRYSIGSGEVTDSTSASASGSLTVQRVSYETWNKLVALGSTNADELAMDALFADSELLGELGSNITEANLYRYIFICDENDSDYKVALEAGTAKPSFIWFVPKDTGNIVSAWRIRYNVDISEYVAIIVSNIATVWYKNIDASDKTSWSDADGLVVKENLNEKNEDGIQTPYIGADGNYYIDWEIEIGVGENSSEFEQIFFIDELPYYVYKDPTTGVEYNLYDWMAGVEDGDVWSSMTAEELKALSDKMFDITTDSSDPAVQAVVDRAAGVFKTQNAVPMHSYSNTETNENFKLSTNIEKMITSGAKSQYSGDMLGAGQFTSPINKDYISKGDTWTAGSILFYLGDLPATGDEGYTIYIRYTTQVNPFLVELIEDGKVSSNIDLTAKHLIGNEAVINNANHLIEMDNEVRLKQALVYDDDPNKFYVSSYRGSENGELTNDFAYYYFDFEEIDPVVSKTGEYKVVDGEPIFQYEVVLNPNNTVVSENTEYQLMDYLSIEGLDYIEDSITVSYGTKNNVVYTTNPEVSAVATYNGLISSDFGVNSDNKTFMTITFDNTDGDFATTNGMLRKVYISYSVSCESNLIPEGTTLINTASFQKLVSGSFVNIGTAKCELEVANVITKELMNKPTFDNDYVASFLVAVNMNSPYVNDNIAVINDSGRYQITIYDEPAQALDIFAETLEVTVFKDGTKITTDHYDVVDSGYVEGENGRIFVTIESDEIYDRYNLFYDAYVEGDNGDYATVVNIASLDNSDFSYKYQKAFYKQEIASEATVKTCTVKVLKCFEGNFFETVANVEFELHKYDFTSRTWTKVNTNKDLVTNGEGILEINNSLSVSSDELVIVGNTLYALVETKSANGYVIPAEPIYFYLNDGIGFNYSFKDYYDSTIYRSARDLVGNYYIHRSSITITAPNQYLTLNVVKTDKLDGTALTGAEFTLYSDRDCTQKVATSVLNPDDKTMSVISGISTDEEVYYLKETKAPVDYALDSTVYKIVIENNTVSEVVSLDNSKTLTIDKAGSEVTITSFPNSTITGNIKVTKTVKTEAFTTSSYGFEFTFKATVSGVDLSGNYPYTIYNASGNEVTSGTITSGGTFKLSNGQSIVIKSIPENARYTITETKVEGYDTSYSIIDFDGKAIKTDTKSTVATGTITSGCLDTVAFVNQAVAHVTITAKKELDAGTLSSLKETFEFELYSTLGATDRYIETKSASKASGNITFTQLNFTSNGYSEFTIREVVPLDAPDYLEYTDTEVVVNIRVTVDSETGGLIPTVTYSGGEGDNNNTFINKYSADGPYDDPDDPDNPSEDDLGLVFTATKEVNGSSTHDMMTAGKFTFGIYEGNTLVAKGTNDASGKITFDKIIYYLNGTTDDTGYHYYTVKETGTAGNGWTYDNHEYAVTVYVSNNGDGTLSADVRSGARKSGDAYVLTSTDGDVTFENTYEFENARVQIATTKKLYGAEISSGQFSFGVYENGKLVGETTNNANGGVSIYLNYYRTLDSNGVEQTNIGTHNYVLKEIIPNPVPAGYTYSTAERTFTLEIVDNGDGTIKVGSYSGINAVSAANNVYGYMPSPNPAFINFYDASGTLFLEASKEIDGRNLVAGEFEFTATEYKVVAGVKTATGNVYTATNDAAGNIVFEGIEYIKGYETITTPYTHYETIDETGTYYYEIAEVDNGAGGVEYDTTVYEVTVLVADNGDGTLSVTPSANAAKLNFTNGYEAKGSISFTAIKNINGSIQNDQMTTGKFAFVIYEGNKAVSSGTNDGNGNIIFSDINYTVDDIGIHVYTVVEQDTGVEGWNYDSHKYTVTVTVADNGDGTLSTTVEGATKSGATYAIKPAIGKDATFENTYEVSEQVLINADVILEGATLKDGQFTFGIYDAKGNLVCFAKNDANGNIVFDKFEFYRAVDANGNEVKNLGTNTYEIKQIIPNPKAGGYTYDEDVYTVIITATDDGKGNISVVVENDALIYTKSTDSYAINYDSSKKATWVNSYEAIAGPFDFSDIEGLDGIVKKMTGRNPLDGEFEFVVYEYKMVGTSYAATGKVFKTTNDANGNIDFDDITYVLNETRNDTGTYMYVFKEVIPMAADKNPAVTYDTTEYKLEVAVSDNGDGTLNVVSISNFRSITFTNNYEAYGSAEFSATVSINGNKNHIYMIPGTFTYEITENGKVIATATNDANGNIDFSTIEFVADANGSDVGTHTYTIKQVDCNIPGYECDDTVYTVVIEVVDDYVGNLTAEIVSGATLDGDVIAVTPATGKTENFENVYTVSETLIIETFKELLGRVIEDEQFEFGIYEDGELIATGKNDVNGNVVFEDIEFFRDYDATNGETTYLGTHYYQIKEIIPDPKVGGYVYSEDVINVTVTAVDDGKGDITFTVTNTTAATAENTYETNDKFTNEYWADGFIEFEGLKELLGRTMDDGEFKFLVTEYKIVNGERVATGNVYEGTNDVNGIITFDEIIYNMNPNVNDCGEYVYVVTEFIPDEDNKRGGVTYDEETSYEVTVVVTDNGNGTLKASPSDNFQSLDFTNIYNATGSLDISVTIKAESAGEQYDDVNDFNVNMGNKFKVDLYEIIPGAGPNGEDIEKLLGTIEVPVDGTVSFDEIEYFINGEDNNIGDHRYKIVQKSTQDAPGYENGIDDTEYYINVSVTDNRDGTLNVVITNDEGEEVGESGTNATYNAVFTNEYMAEDEWDPEEPTPTATPDPSVTPDGPSPDGPSPDGPSPDGPSPDGPSPDGPSPDGPSPDGPSPDGPSPDGPSPDGPSPDGPSPDGPSPDGPSPDGPSPDGPTPTPTYAAVINKVIDNADKMVTGGALEDDQFSFTMYEGDSTLSADTPIEELTVVSTGTSKADGSIDFTEIHYTMATRGTHYYVIYEDADKTIDGVLNSFEPVFVVVQVLNNGDGTFTIIDNFYIDVESTDEDGNPITERVEVETVVIHNKATETKFDVVNEAGKNIADADIEIRDLDGNVITSYTSTEDTETIHGLKVNTVYVMHETDAPFGYVLGEDIYFMLDEDGNLIILENPEDTEGTPAESVVMVNELTRTKINVIDPEGTNLPGAELEILDEEGNVVGTLTSSDQTDIYEGLDVNTKYTLHEVKAPDGYVLGEDITFWIDENGNLYIVDEEGNDVPVESLDMVNEKTKVEINVIDPEGTHLPGAELEILDEDGNVVGKITTEGETIIYEGLVTGKDYILHETKAPDGYLPDDDIHFWIDENGNLFIVDEDGNDVPAESLDMTNEKTKVDISVEDPDGNNIPGGKFEIIDPDGNVVDEFISSGDIDTIIGLITGKDYILHQVEAPDGYEPSEDIHFWIDEDGGLHILDKDGNEFMDDKIVVVNKPVVEPGSPSTGDDSNIAPMAIIALMAMAMFVIVLKKKEEENC